MSEHIFHYFCQNKNVINFNNNYFLCRFSRKCQNSLRGIFKALSWTGFDNFLSDGDLLKPNQ